MPYIPVLKVCNLHKALYKSQGFETGKGWTMKISNLEGEIYDVSEYWDRSFAPNTNCCLLVLPQDSQVSLGIPGLFHILDVYTEP